MILSDEFSGSGSIAGIPVLGWDVDPQVAHLTKSSQSFDDQIPGAIGPGVDFTFAVAGSTTGTVKEFFCTAGERAYGTEKGKVTQLTEDEVNDLLEKYKRNK